MVPEVALGPLSPYGFGRFVTLFCWALSLSFMAHSASAISFVPFVLSVFWAPGEEHSLQTTQIYQGSWLTSRSSKSGTTPPRSSCLHRWCIKGIRHFGPSVNLAFGCLSSIFGYLLRCGFVVSSRLLCLTFSYPFFCAFGASLVYSNSLLVAGFCHVPFSVWLPRRPRSPWRVFAAWVGLFCILVQRLSSRHGRLLFHSFVALADSRFTELLPRSPGYEVLRPAVLSCLFKAVVSTLINQDGTTLRIALFEGSSIAIFGENFLAPFLGRTTDTFHNVRSLCSLVVSVVVLALAAHGLSCSCRVRLGTRLWRVFFRVSFTVVLLLGVSTTPILWQIGPHACHDRRSVTCTRVLCAGLPAAPPAALFPGTRWPRLPILILLFPGSFLFSLPIPAVSAFPRFLAARLVASLAPRYLTAVAAALLFMPPLPSLSIILRGPPHPVCSAQSPRARTTLTPVMGGFPSIPRVSSWAMFPLVGSAVKDSVPAKFASGSPGCGSTADAPRASMSWCLLTAVARPAVALLLREHPASGTCSPVVHEFGHRYHLLHGTLCLGALLLLLLM